MSRYQRIYRERADDYDALVAAEDHGQTLRALLRDTWGDLRGREVIELGVGTGRVTRWLLQEGARVRGIEQSPAMVEGARARLAAEGFDASALVVGDAWEHRFEPATADLAVAGWVFGHAVSWHPEDWQARVRGALAGMRASLRPGGLLLVIETLGTGHEVPTPPPALAPYYELLEAEGLGRAWARSDYLFSTAAEAERLTRFFFGDALGDRVRDRGARRVAECTGVWSRRV